MKCGVIEWHSVKLDGMPPHRETVMVTCGVGNTERNVYTQMRYNQLLDEYIEKVKAEYPAGAWECEVDGEYWDIFDIPVIAWAFYPEPYKGE